jgi:hypothetical protein
LQHPQEEGDDSCHRLLLCNTAHKRRWWQLGLPWVPVYMCVGLHHALTLQPLGFKS